MGIVLPSPPSFRQIPQFIDGGKYGVDVVWSHLESWLKSHEEYLDLDPDFQRAHVWDVQKQQMFVEFCLRGGTSARNIYFNCPGFTRIRKTQGTIELVDGKQRLEAVRSFMRDDLTVFGGHVYSDFVDPLRLSGPSFRVHVNELETRAEVLQWYLEMNTGGVLHTEGELDRVRGLLKKELSKSGG